MRYVLMGGFLLRGSRVRSCSSTFYGDWKAIAQFSHV